MKKTNCYYLSRCFHYHTVYPSSLYSQVHEGLEDQTQIHSFRLSFLAQSHASFSSFCLSPLPSTFLSSFIFPSPTLFASLTPSSRYLSTCLDASSFCQVLFLFSFCLCAQEYRLLAHHSLPTELTRRVALPLHESHDI